MPTPSVPPTPRPPPTGQPTEGVSERFVRGGGPQIGHHAHGSAAHPAPASSAADMGIAEGQHVGPYKLLQLIGEGGFGSVFMAEQSTPVHRRVALKVIKLGMDTRRVIARFEAERQALAMMDHPNIARVLDAGATESGRPYFVMELVKGAPITKYADRERLTIPQRLDLFQQVCHAVQHAHTKGVMHRDLKPSNVLVSTHDGKPFAKVIDFGIAKATDQRLTDKTLFTEFAQLIGTPEYMSPEQAEGSLDIDTRTDIYSLGVLLYELLCGVTPFDGRLLRSAAYAEMARIIREVEPVKPSTRVSTANADNEPRASATGASQSPTDPSPASEHQPQDPLAHARGSLSASLETLAKSRQTEPKSLTKLLKGDLDWIVMKALEKDRKRRYETASDFASDVERHLGGNAVIAAPPSLIYRFRKTLRRNRTLVVASAAVTMSLLLGMATTAWQATQANREAEKARSAEKQQEQLAHQERASRLEAQAALAVADTAKLETQKAEENANRESYRVLIASANAAIEQNRLSDAHVSLDACPTHLRNWEWRFLSALCDNRIAEYSHQHSRAFYGQLVNAHSTPVAVCTTCGAILDTSIFAHSKTIHQISCAQHGHIAMFRPSIHSLSLRVWQGDRTTRTAIDFGRRGIRYSHSYFRAGEDLFGNEYSTVNHRYVAIIADSLARPILVIPIDYDAECSGVSAFSDNGRFAVFVRSGTIAEVIDIARGTRFGALTLLNNGYHEVSAVAIDSSGTFVAAAAGEVIHIRDACNGQLLSTLFGPVGDIDKLFFSSDGQYLLALGSDEHMSLWNTTSLHNIQALTMPLHSELMPGVMSADGSAAFASGQTSRSPEDRPQQASLRVEQLSSIQYSGFIVSFNPLHIRSSLADWSRLINPLLDKENGGDYNYSASCFSSDGKILLTAFNAVNARVWNTLNGSLIDAFGSTRTRPFDLEADGDEGYIAPTGVQSMAMRPGYNQSAFGLADGSVRLWEYDSGREIDTFCAHTLPVEGVAFCEDGSKMVSVSRDGLMCLWDASTGRLLSGVHAAVHPELNPRASLLVSLSPDGRLMAVPNMVAHELRFHRTADGVLAYTVDLASLNIIDSFPSIRISYSPLGTYCFVHDEYGYTNSMTKSLCIRIADGQPRTFTGRFACASPDETRLIAFGLDGSMRLLDIETLTEVFRIGPFGSYYPQARFTGYGDAISVLTENRAITLDGRSWPIRHSENVKINKSPPH